MSTRQTIDLEKKAKADPSYTDFTGHRHGRFTVIKYLGHSKWSCRCVCGQYESRSSKAIKNHIKYKGNLDEDMCYACRDSERLKIVASAKAIGHDFITYARSIRPVRKSMREMNKTFDKNRC